jgi:hypothetical protein
MNYDVHLSFPCAPVFSFERICPNLTEFELYEKILFTSVPYFVPRSTAVISGRLMLQMMVENSKNLELLCCSVRHQNH